MATQAETTEQLRAALAAQVKTTAEIKTLLAAEAALKTANDALVAGGRGICPLHMGQGNPKSWASDGSRLPRRGDSRTIF